MKNRPQQKRTSPSQQSGKASSEAGTYVGIVPVKISISHDGTKLEEYEAEIVVEFTEATSEGKKNLLDVLYLTTEKGMSTDEALFVIASKLAEEFSQELVAGLNASPPLSLEVRIKRNGEISYAKSVT